MDRAALAAELTSLLGELSRFTVYLSGDPADADDLVQETLIRALGHCGDLKEPRALRGWLFRIARNTYIDLRRARAGRERLIVLEGGAGDVAALETPAVEAINPIERHDLERALATLSEGARTALLLADLWELDHEEVAEILDLPVGTVKSRVARARVKIALLLAADSAPGRVGGEGA